MGTRHAIVLAGGRSQRMGTDKAMLVLDGRTLLQRAVDACGEIDSVVVAGPQTPLDHETDSRVRFVVENPPFGGPVAGVAAGVAALSDAADDDSVVVLACDLASPAAVAALLDDAEIGRDGVVLVDDEGWQQFLAGRYRLGALRERLAALGDVRDMSMGRFAGVLDVTSVTAPPRVTADIDTPAEAEAWGINTHHPKRRPEDDKVKLAIVAQWSDELRAVLGTSGAPCDADAILKMASVVAKRVARPAVPVTGFLAGWAAAMAHAAGEDADEAAARVIGETIIAAAARPVVDGPSARESGQSGSDQSGSDQPPAKGGSTST